MFVNDGLMVISPENLILETFFGPFPFGVTTAKNFLQNISLLSYIRQLWPHVPNGTMMIISDKISYTSFGSHLNNCTVSDSHLKRNKSFRLA